MIDAVGAAVGPAVRPANTKRDGAQGLDAELAKCMAQLADWVSCASAKTSAGKEKIAEISGRISAIQAQKKRAESAAQDGSQAPVVQSKSMISAPRELDPMRPPKLIDSGAFLDYFA